MSTPHALVLPLPYQGHVIPLMKLSHCLVDHGFQITFVNTELNHQRVVAAMHGSGDEAQASSTTAVATLQIRLVSIPDGLGAEVYRDALKLMRGLAEPLPSFLEELVLRSIDGGEKITCIIYDRSLVWAALPLAKKMGLRSAVFSPMSALVTFACLNADKLVEDGIVDSNGAPVQKDLFQLAPDLPFMNAAHLPWNCIGDEEARKNTFHFLVKNTRALSNMSPDFILCNSCRDMEAPVIAHAPFIHPVGPLISDAEQPGSRPLAASFWSEDGSCTAWLEKQQPKSVIYVAFGSTKMFTRKQFEELALGLEMTGKPFLLVVRPDCYADAGDEDDGMNTFLDEFRSRVAARGRMVEWAAQQEVLTHSAISCFICHCGWNSTMEGVMAGTPFLCWPYSTDNFISESYICDVWRIGLRLEPDEEEVVERKQIETKVEELLGDEEMRLRANQLKEMAMRSVKEGGSSFETIKSFAQAMRAR